jgi:flagellar hook protein FlgE
MTAVSGLRAESEALDVVGDNIANANTSGFKRQRSIFEDVLGRSAFAEGPGAGVRQTQARQEFSQGTIVVTGVSTDLALSGDGFFAVSGSVNGITGTFYSRGGNFVISPDGYLRNTNRLKLVGYAANPDGTFQAAAEPLRIPTSAIPANPTTAGKITANLDAESPVLPSTFSPTDPSNTANFSSTMSVYDSLGAAHSLDVYFVKTGPATWDYHAMVNASTTSTAPANAGDNFVEVGSGQMTFDTNGALNTSTITTPISPNFVGTTAQTITLDLGTPISAGTGNDGYDGVTQFASPSNVSSQEQNGYASGAISGITVDNDGTVVGLYDNGENLAIGQLAIAKFRANEGLARAGENLWLDTEDSGQAAFGIAGVGGRGGVSSGAIENSNVEMAQEMVGLISHQRAYGANSKVITAADDMLAELMTLKK